MDLTNTRSPRKAACRAASVLTAGALMLSAGVAHAASQTYTGTGLFSTGFGGTAVSGNTLVFGGVTPATVNNDLTGLTLGAGTSANTYLGDAIDFTGTTSYTLTGNAIQQQGSIVNTSSVLQTINLNLTQNGAAGLSFAPYGYNYDTGTGGLNIGGSIGALGQTSGTNNFHDFTKIGSGTLTFTGGTQTLAAVFPRFGTMVVGSGATINAQFFSSVGQLDGDNATLTLSGTGVYNAGGDFNVSDNAGSSAASLDQGTLNVQGSAALNIAAGAFFVGKSNFTVGTANLTGGTVNMNSASGFSSIGLAGGSVGTMNVSGGTFNESGTQDFNVGDSGTGTLNVSGTGLVNTNNGGLLIGRQSSSTGTVNLNAGGTIATALVRKDLGTGTFNFNGGTLVANAASTTFFGNQATTTSALTANVQSGGAIINTNGNDVTITASLLHAGTGKDGGLTKNGLGTLTLSGADTYNGNTRVNAGALSLTTISSLGSGNLLLASSATPSVNLLFTGTETIGALSFNLGTSFVPVGTYGSLASAATNKFAAFTGMGILNVAAAPEPSQYAAFGLGLLGLGGLALRARRRTLV